MSPLKRKIYDIIFGTETRAGKLFDIALIISVLLSVITVMLESVDSLNVMYAREFEIAEWLFTILFSIELALRLYCVEKKSKYIFSFFGVIDVLSIVPLYLTSIFPALRSFGIIRAFRILRIFRILKLNRYMLASRGLSEALFASRAKIIVFLGVTVTTVFIIGAFMYLIEGEENGFTSIPESIYWAVVTITTVGYGDITPQTVPGKLLSSVLMLVGYGIIVVPTGLVSAEMVNQKLDKRFKTNVCPNCNHAIHTKNAKFCSDCGQELFS